MRPNRLATRRALASVRADPLDKPRTLAQHRAMLPDPAPSDLAPGQWKPNPPALWVYIMIGVARIIVSGFEVAMTRIGLRR